MGISHLLKDVASIKEKNIQRIIKELSIYNLKLPREAGKVPLEAHFGAVKMMCSILRGL